MYRKFAFIRREPFSTNGKTYDIRVYQNPVTQDFVVMILNAGNEVSDVRMMDEDAAKDVADSVTTLIDIVKSDIASDTSGKFT